MVQEVQQQWNWYQTPNRIEWIWYSERKISDHTQVRNKKTRMSTFNSGAMFIQNDYWYDTWEVFNPSWTYSDSDSVYYKVIWGDIYITQRWAYSVEYSAADEWTLQADKCVFRVYVEGKQVYSVTARIWDHTPRFFTLNLGRMNKLTVSYAPVTWAGVAMNARLKLTKL